MCSVDPQLTSDVQVYLFPSTTVTSEDCEEGYCYNGQVSVEWPPYPPPPPRHWCYYTMELFGITLTLSVTQALKLSSSKPVQGIVFPTGEQLPESWCHIRGDHAAASKEKRPIEGLPAVYCERIHIFSLPHTVHA